MRSRDAPTGWHWSAWLIGLVENYSHCVIAMKKGQAAFDDLTLLPRTGQSELVAQIHTQIARHAVVGGRHRRVILLVEHVIEIGT